MWIVIFIILFALSVTAARRKAAAKRLNAAKHDAQWMAARGLARPRRRGLQGGRRGVEQGAPAAGL
jgi:hypothetical protein